MKNGTIKSAYDQAAPDSATKARIWMRLQEEADKQTNSSFSRHTQNAGNRPAPLVVTAKKERPVLHWAGLVAACAVLTVSVLAAVHLLNQKTNQTTPGESGPEAMMQTTAQASTSEAEQNAQALLPDAYFLQHAESFLSRAGFLHVDPNAFQLSVLPASDEQDWNELTLRWDWDSQSAPVVLRYEQATGILLSISGMNLTESRPDGIEPEQAALQFYASLTEEQKNVAYHYSTERLSLDSGVSYRFRFFPLSTSDDPEGENCLEICVGYNRIVLVDNDTPLAETSEPTRPQTQDDYYHQLALDYLNQAGYTDLEQESYRVYYHCYATLPFDALSRDEVEVSLEDWGSVYLDYETCCLLQLHPEWTVSGNGPCATQEEADALVTQFYESLPVPQGFSIKECAESEKRPGWLCYGFAEKITAEGLPDACYGRGSVTILLNPSNGDMQFIMAEDYPLDSYSADETPLTEDEAWEVIRENMTPDQYELFANTELTVYAYSPFVLKDIVPQTASSKVARLYWSADYVHDNVLDSVWVDCYTGEFYRVHFDA